MSDEEPQTKRPCLDLPLQQSEQQAQPCIDFLQKAIDEAGLRIGVCDPTAESLTTDVRRKPQIGHYEVYCNDTLELPFWHAFSHFVRQLQYVACERVGDLEAYGPRGDQSTLITMERFRWAVRNNSGCHAESYVFEPVGSPARQLRAKVDLMNVLRFGAEQVLSEILDAEAAIEREAELVSHGGCP